MLSLTADRTALSPPPLSELSDSEGSSSAAPSPFESPASSRASISAPDSMATSCCKWGCCGAVTAAAKIAQLSGGQSFAALNLSWVLCSAFTWIFHNVLCNFLFRCGCTWNWAGSWDRCNVHNARGPRCPWCATPSDYPNFLWAADGKLFTLAMVGAAAMALRYFRIKNILLRVLCVASCSILTWVLLGILSGLAFWQLTDYPYFMWFSKPPYPNQTDCTPNPCKSPA